MSAPTWREALIEAQAGIADAYERRRLVVQAAHDAGLSMRRIGAVLEMSAATVSRMVESGMRGRLESKLDAPATVSRVVQCADEDSAGSTVIGRR
jgi:hypothetical protein